MAGWRSYARAAQAPADFTPGRETDADEPLMLYFTSGTTA
ncbi:AMP-dependent synthetase [Streptomyces badius]